MNLQYFLYFFFFFNDTATTEIYTLSLHVALPIYEEVEKDVEWLSYRQHFFSSILIADKPFKTAILTSKNLVLDEEIDSVFTKSYAVSIPLELKGGELNESLSMYYGPTDSIILKKYDKNLEESIPFGWGIFGWINKSLFIPLFGFLSGFLPYGIAIIVMTILIKLLMSFVQYKQLDRKSVV